MPDIGSNTFVFESMSIVSSKYLHLTFRNEKYLNTFLKYLIFSVSINISVSRSHVMPAKLITFTATSPNSANYL